MRPITFVLAGLALAVVAKIGVTLMDEPGFSSAGADDNTPFVSAASAAATDAESAAPAPDPKVCKAPEELLASIQQERELLEAQKEQHAKREAELDLTAETLEVEQQRLADLKTELEALLDKVKAAHTADVDRLVALYRNMKPKDAAAIMNDLDIEVSVMVLGTMNERDAAPIMAALTPVRARAISQIILERSKLPGDQRLDDIKL
jgi:flagellar motility protein MotE (MotC chaperone)